MYSAAHFIIFDRMEGYICKKLSVLQEEQILFLITDENEFSYAIENNQDFSPFVSFFYITPDEDITGEEKEQLLQYVQEKRTIPVLYHRYKASLEKENKELFSQPVENFTPPISGLNTYIIYIALFLVFVVFIFEFFFK